MDFELKGKVAVVTGASKGMGRAIASGLAAEGARVCIVARDAGVLGSAAEAIRAETSADVLAIPGDVSDPNLAQMIVERTTGKWGRLDIVVNNAGGPPPGAFLEHAESVWLQALNANFLSAVRLTKAAVPHMKSKRWGRIVSVTSTVAREPSPEMVLSASARAALSAFSKAISVELAQHNITVNTVCPGSVLTGRAESLLQRAAEKEKKSYEDVLARSQAGIPIRRFATPKEIADVVVFLASERGSYLTGTALSVDGGLTKGLF
ncbi:MAG: SDR family oxidoreductase [Elusimicrobia bacterium]|nr:SDR family oxidoreductase [Elusimicrobiota bacterium]